MLALYGLQILILVGLILMDNFETHHNQK